MKIKTLALILFLATVCYGEKNVSHTPEIYISTPFVFKVKDSSGTISYWCLQLKGEPEKIVIFDEITKEEYLKIQKRIYE